MMTTTHWQPTLEMAEWTEMVGHSRQPSRRPNRSDNIFNARKNKYDRGKRIRKKKIPTENWKQFENVHFIPAPRVGTGEMIFNVVLCLWCGAQRPMQSCFTPPTMATKRCGKQRCCGRWFSIGAHSFVRSSFVDVFLLLSPLFLVDDERKIIFAVCSHRNSMAGFACWIFAF